MIFTIFLNYGFNPGLGSSNSCSKYFNKGSLEEEAEEAEEAAGNKP